MLGRRPKHLGSWRFQCVAVGWGVQGVSALCKADSRSTAPQPETEPFRLLVLTREVQDVPKVDQGFKGLRRHASREPGVAQRCTTSQEKAPGPAASSRAATPCLGLSSGLPSSALSQKRSSNFIRRRFKVHTPSALSAILSVATARQLWGRPPTHPPRCTLRQCPANWNLIAANIHDRHASVRCGPSCAITTFTAAKGHGFVRAWVGVSPPAAPISCLKKACLWAA